MVIPNMHGVSHRLKRIAAVHNAKVVFSFPGKLSCLPRLVNSGSQRMEPRHTKGFQACVKECVYKIRCACDSTYNGQTGRCINDRLQEHASRPSGYVKEYLTNKYESRFS